MPSSDVGCSRRASLKVKFFFAFSLKVTTETSTIAAMMRVLAAPSIARAALNFIKLWSKRQVQHARHICDRSMRHRAQMPPSRYVIGAKMMGNVEPNRTSTTSLAATMCTCESMRASPSALPAPRNSLTRFSIYLCLASQRSRPLYNLL